MTITFVERGIEFVFADDSLVSIGVFEPDDDFDYKKFREGVKDLYLYIRDPESKK